MRTLQWGEAASTQDEAHCGHDHQRRQNEDDHDVDLASALSPLTCRGGCHWGRLCLCGVSIG
jgi:hypothetical protein